MKKISIITTRQNFVWKSMQEVFPAIEKCWSETQVEARIINVDNEPLRDHIHFLMKSDVLVVIAFNETIARYIRHVRKSLQLEIPIILHLYGYATIGAWPLKRFGALDCLTESDLFIGTCQGDINCMHLCFENAKVLNIPYPYVPYEFEKKINNKDELCFAYVGRISDQKNLDVLVEAYLLVKKKHSNIPHLYIYGEEDFLGWPNFGKEASNCRERIVKLIDDNHLDKNIHLMGYRDRSEIYTKLSSNHIFLSASTHSDENFGMAAMRSLAIGGRAVLSSWGGHFNFKIHHPNEVQLVEVQMKESCPTVDVELFAKSMEYFLKNEDSRNEKKLSDYFSESSVKNVFNEIVFNLPVFSPKPLSPTTMGQIIFNQQLEYEKNGFKQKAFSGYDDLVFQKITAAYMT